MFFFQGKFHSSKEVAFLGGVLIYPKNRGPPAPASRLFTILSLVSNVKYIYIHIVNVLHHLLYTTDVHIYCMKNFKNLNKKTHSCIFCVHVFNYPTSVVLAATIDHLFCDPLICIPPSLLFPMRKKEPRCRRLHHVHLQTRGQCENGVDALLQSSTKQGQAF